MEGVELAIPAVVLVPTLMGSDVLLGARVCATEAETRESDSVSQFSLPKIDECTSLVGHRGISSASHSSSQIKKTDTELYRTSSLLHRPESGGSSRGLDHVSGPTASISGSEGKPIQRKVGKAQRNGSGPFKKLRMSQTDILLLQSEANDTKMDSDKLGSHLVKCSNTDKSQAGKQKNPINGRRCDRRNAKVPVKAKYDTFLLKTGLPALSPATGGSNAFGMHGPKPDVHNVTELMDDISLDELLDGSYKCSNLGKDTGNKVATGNGKILDSVMKAFSILRLQSLQQRKQTEDTDVHVDSKIPVLSPPSNTSAAISADGDENSKDQDSNIKAKASVDMNDDTHLYLPKDVLERLGLPPPKDLESLLQDAVKPATSVKLADSRSAKPLSTRVSLPPFPWSHNYNGHHKSNNDATKTSNRNTCQGRWMKIRSDTSFIGGGTTESFLILESLTYDDSLVPPGKLKYRLPELERHSSSTVPQHSSQHNLSSAVCSRVPQSSPALHSPRVLTAAQTLCDMATHYLKQNSNGILKRPKQPPPKATKALKSRSSEIPGEEFPTSKPDVIHNYEVRGVEPGPSAKKPKLSVVERRQEFSHVQAVIGLSSVSAPRSNRPSPIKLSRDSVSEARHSNDGFAKPPFTVPPPPRVLDRSTHNPQKPRKATPMDWNRSRS